MQIKQFTLENFRGFGSSYTIDFSSKQPTVIVGVNGSGKTSLLDAISQVSFFPINKLVHLTSSDKVPEIFTKYDIHIGKQNIYLGSQLATNQFSFHTIRLHYETVNIPTISKAEDIQTYIRRNFEDIEEGELPIFVYYQTNRHFQQEEKRVSTNGIRTNRYLRYKIYENSLSPSINIEKIIGWYQEQINIQNQIKVDTSDLAFELPTIRAIKKGTNTFLDELEQTALSEINIQVSKYANTQVLVAKKGEQELEFEQLSAGEKMIIGLVMDIIYRISIGNPKHQNPLAISGVVLIDEIELHLHPKWQMNILNALQQTFPNIQFIIATHSPLVINQVRSEQLIFVDNNGITSGTNIHEVYGKDVNSIVEYIMGAKHRPPKIEQKINEIEALLDQEQPDTKQAKALLHQLSNIIDPNDTKLLELDTLITIEDDDFY